VSGLVLFGSAARGTASRTSDVDIYVQFAGLRQGAGLLLFQANASRMLGRSIHAVPNWLTDNWLLSELALDGIWLDDQGKVLLDELRAQGEEHK
jgi:Nucleotidyltransferase domain